MITATTPVGESEGFRLYYRQVMTWPVPERYEWTYQAVEGQRFNQRVRGALISPAKPSEPIEDAEWKWHRNKTYSKINHAKAAATCHYTGRYSAPGMYETKIVKYKLTTILEEEITE